MRATRLWPTLVQTKLRRSLTFTCFHLVCLRQNPVDSGLVNPRCIGFIGNGVVVHVPSFFSELDTLEKKGTHLSVIR